VFLGKVEIPGGVEMRVEERSSLKVLEFLKFLKTSNLYRLGKNYFSSGKARSFWK